MPDTDTLSTDSRSISREGSSNENSYLDPTWIPEEELEGLEYRLEGELPESSGTLEVELLSRTENYWLEIEQGSDGYTVRMHEPGYRGRKYSAELESEAVENVSSLDELVRNEFVDRPVESLLTG